MQTLKPSMHEVTSDWTSWNTWGRKRIDLIGLLAMVKGKWTAFIVRFSNRWPLKALYNITQHSLTHAQIHTHDGGVSHARHKENLDIQLGGVGDRTSNLPVTNQPALPSEPHAPDGTQTSTRQSPGTD